MRRAKAPTMDDLWKPALAPAVDAFPVFPAQRMLIAGSTVIDCDSKVHIDEGSDAP